MENMVFVKNLSIIYKTEDKTVQALEKVSFNLRRGKNLGIVGESGSGKTSLALSLLGLINSPHRVLGEIHYDGIDFLALTEKEKKQLRWKKIAMVFQNSLEVLNPVMKIGSQIVEPLKEVSNLTSQEYSQEAERLLELVGLETHWRDAYPHQLSGGMRQRVLLAMAISCNPQFLILDEPTSSLDGLSKRDLIDTIKELQKKINFSMIVISHDLAIVKELTNNMMVLYGGRIIERGDTKAVLENPAHPYTRGFINSSVDIFPYKDLWGIPGEAGENSINSGCVFVGRCTQAQAKCNEHEPLLRKISSEREIACNREGIVDILIGKNLTKEYSLKNMNIKALNNVDIRVRQGETVALVGKSGSGKSTLAHILAGFTQADKGKVYLENQEVFSNWAACQEGGVQLILQDPFSSISHRLTVAEVISEPLRVNKIGDLKETEQRVQEVLKAVQLPTEPWFSTRYCSSLSGGQRQRVAIARGLIMKPKVLLADEITSMLDVSTQANLMRLLKGLQNNQGFTMLYITHDLNLARKIAERIIVLHEGVIVEEGSASRITEEACHGYTKELLKAGLVDV